MNGKTNPALDDFLSERRAAFESAAKNPGAAGAAARLELLLDSSQVPHWLMDEDKRGTERAAICIAAANAVANILAPVAVNVGPVVFQLMLAKIPSDVGKFCSGQTETTVFMEEDDGRGGLATVKGLRERGVIR